MPVAGSAGPSRRVPPLIPLAVCPLSLGWWEIKSPSFWGSLPLLLHPVGGCGPGQLTQGEYRRARPHWTGVSGGSGRCQLCARVCSWGPSHGDVQEVSVEGAFFDPVTTPLDTARAAWTFWTPGATQRGVRVSHDGHVKTEVMGCNGNALRRGPGSPSPSVWTLR